MVSVAFAIWPFPQRCDGTRPARGVPVTCASLQMNSKRRANFEGDLTPVWLRYCIAARDRWAFQNDVDVLSGFSEPHGFDGAVSGGSLDRPQISQSGAPGHVGPGDRPALGGAGA